VFGLAPRLTSFVAYGLLVWSFLLELIGGILGSNGWVLDTSPFHQMAAASAVAPNWTSGAIMIVIGLTSAALGVVALVRRDLAGD
jgi:putative exporter of polyketide antibiotics